MGSDSVRQNVPEEDSWVLYGLLKAHVRPDLVPEVQDRRDY